MLLICVEDLVKVTLWCKYLLFSFDFDADVQSDGTRNSRLVGSLLKIVPNIHFAGKGAYL